MAPSSSSSAAATSVQVALRIRPTTPQDSVNIPARFQRTVIHAASPTSVAVDSTASTPSSSGASTAAAPSTSSAANAKKQLFTFDQVHPPETTQHALFTSTAKPLVSRFLEGFNCTILAYGQTSSGKTFTMTGIDLDADPSDPSNGMGIIPRAVSTIFQMAKEMKQERGNNWNYTLKGSFLELYNEDLIDLLSMDEGGSGKREVQIREGKDGSIIWGGLREVTVKNAAEVMSLIRQGTAIRRTNETDMNAQSSRSHAIFSLTLIQRKYTGSGPPPRSSSPLPPPGRSPSRLARPGSMIAGPSGGRVSSPTFGRPGTPSFASAMGRGGLRPASALGTHGADGRGSIDEDAGEWVTVVSKFHFVDLAGSERLKRTAAAGDRIKEGISINSGLLALGNVISALGDPARVKSHTASYVPYRDSKLTRLLQDSLGGNAHTLMIACVSPAEWNTAETVNTLKYANRARNIKNRALITEKEEGWDDVEWLQGMVTRLRKDLKALKEGGMLPPSAASAVQARDVEGAASKKMLQSFNELKSTYEDLREKYVARNEELNRLRKEHGESHRASTTGTIPGMSKYEEIVGPVIEEYEKTISAMEAELSLNRAALRHTNELVEEKEEELSQLVERKAATELYVEELRARVAKLTEREASTEAYVHDLEEKIKQYDESNTSSSESMGELKRELSRFKDTESHSAQYIADLELRLARADESVLAYRQTVEKLEAEADRRREEAEILQERLDSLKKDGELWRSDLEEREQRVRELEKKMEEWEAKRREASEARERLGGVADEVAQAQKKLEANMADFGKASEASSSASGASTPNTMDLSLENQLITLQQTHTATLADLSSVTAKYRDALREISDLAAQIQELKLSNSTPSTSEFPERTMDASPRRRMTGGRHREGSDVSSNGAGRRLFFRQAASTESLHSRSLSQSQSLSQELSLARSRKTSLSSYGTSSPTHSPGHSRPNLSISLPAVNINPSERSVTSLEKEIMRLQDVLKEREQEIAHLEVSLKEKDGSLLATLPPTPEAEVEPPNGEVSPGVFLSPKTMGRFDDIKDTLQNGHGRTDSLTSSEPDESLQRLNDLMRAMAQKESQHREEVDSLNDELLQLRRQHDELTALSQNQTLNMSNELDSLRRKHEEDLIRLEEVEKREAELQATLAEAEARHASEVEMLRSEHEEALRVKEAEVDRLIAELNQEHSASLESLKLQLTETASALEKAHSEHAEAFGKLKAEHDEALRSRLEEANATLERLRQEHEITLQEAAAKHAREIKEKEDEAAAILARTEEEYYNGLTKLRGEHSEALERQAAEAATALQRLRDELAAELRMAEIAREGSLSESQSSQAETLKSLQDEHSAAIAKKEADFAEDLAKARAQHAQALANVAAEHKAATEKLLSEHEAALSKAQADAGREIEQLMTSLAKAQDDLATSSSHAEQERKDAQAALQAVKEQQAVIFEEIEVGHKEEIAKLKASHDAALRDAAAQVEQEREALVQKHAEETARLRSEHEQAMAELNAALVATQEELQQALEATREQSAQVLEAEKARLSAALSDLEAQHSQERETLRKDLDLVVNELASYKAAVEEHTLAREEARAAHEAAQAKYSDTISALQQELSEVHDEKAEQSNTISSLQQELSDAHSATAKQSDTISTLQHELSEAQNVTAKQSGTISTLQQELSEAHNDKAELAEQVAALRAELDNTRNEQSKLIKEASKRESLVDELEKHRSVLAEMQHTLQLVKDEKDAIQEEKTKQEIAVRDLQAQLAVAPSPTHEGLPSPARPPQERSISYRSVNGISSVKLPPPTPPPTVPPPPAPRMTSSFSNENAFTSSSTPISVSSSRDSQLDSPATSVTPSLANGHAIGPAADPKVLQQLEDQSRQIEEQETMIKTLNKQLTHCESDLQTHMDLVSTLETSLGDSEKNLRKARMQATELARERDTLNVQIEHLRNELQDTKREVATVRRSIVEEKQSLEHRLDEERRAKERVRQQLDTRMDELQKRKSKFVCL